VPLLQLLEVHTARTRLSMTVCLLQQLLLWPPKATYLATLAWASWVRASKRRPERSS